MNQPIARQRHWLLAIFVLSGFAGLIYQSIWSHYLGLFLGHAAYAQALVLAIFMGGMAAGAAWIARAGEGWRNLVRGYAIVEAVVGGLGLLFHWIFTGVLSFSYDVVIPALGAPWSVDIARWIIATLLILPQTILLGMTFPLMSGGLIRRFPGQSGNLLGGLYFTNSIGAAIGALTAVFVLLPWVGLPGAMAVAGILNFVVAALAWWLSRDPEPAPPEPLANVAPVEQRLRHSPLLRIVLLGTALSGAASFVYEIVWVRMLSMAVGSTMHAFELMLASFIAGIALGGLWVRKRADSTDSPLRLVGWMQIGMGVAALASLAVYANSFSWVGWLITSLAKTDGGYSLYNLGTASIAILIMLPAAFFAGSTLPLFTVSLLRAGYGERSIGRVYAWNTLGSIVGVVTAIHVLIPMLGLKLSLCIAAFVDLGIGLVLLRLQANNSRAMVQLGFAAGVAAMALVVGLKIHFDPLQLASGVFRHGISAIPPNQRVVFYRDGKTSSISVVAAPDGSVNIATNGKPDASVRMEENQHPTDDEPTMTLAAALPLAMLDAPKRVGVIGFGSGMTTHSLLGDSRLTQVDTIEIEQAMVEGANAFGPRVARAYTDSRSKIIIDDAKSFFAGQQSKYDVIISEPSNPWISGVGALFSKEFYQFVPRHLNEGGLFVQWVQMYEIDDALVGSILKGLTPAFEDYAAWVTNGSDLIIIASAKGPLPKLDMQRLLAAQPLKKELARLGMTETAHLSFRQVADAKLLRALSHVDDRFPANSDYHPILSLNAPRTRFGKRSADSVLSVPFWNPQLLEALGVRPPLPSSVSPSQLNNFPAEFSTRRARSMAQQMRGEEQAALAPVVILKSLATSCPQTLERRARNLLSAQLRLTTDWTIGFLPTDLLQGLWIKPNWWRCESLAPDYARVMALLDAHARRDYGAMERLGRDWLNAKPEDSFLKEDFDPIALSGVLLSLVHEERWNDLPEVFDKWGQTVPGTEGYLLQRKIIHAMGLQERTSTRPPTPSPAPASSR